MSSPVPAQRRVPIELEPLGDLEKGTMSNELWRELNSIIEYEAKSVQATGVIVPSPARSRGKTSPEGSASREATKGANNNSNPHSASHSSASGGDTSIGSTRFPNRFPAMESFFHALATLGVTKQSYRGLALLHNSAHLGVWNTSNVGGANAALRAQVQDRIAAQTEAIDESLRSATQRAKMLREEQTKDMAAAKGAASGSQPQQQPGGSDQYLKDLQNSRIEAEFERMRDQLRAEDAARREQLDYSRELRQKEAKDAELADKKAKLKAERELRQREREERLRELQQAEAAALDSFETKLREHGKVGVSPKKAGSGAAAAAASSGAAPAAASATVKAPSAASPSAAQKAVEEDQEL